MDKDYSKMRGEQKMKVLRHDTTARFFWAIIFGASIFIGSCAATINYSYDPAADFSTGKNYSWARGWVVNSPESLIEKNVRYYADQSLKEKGYSLSSDKSDFILSMSYKLEYADPYKIKVLNLYIYRAPGKELIWQGTVKSTINADAASPELAEAVKSILANFPPKR